MIIKKRRIDSNGFSLIEVVASIVILTILLLSVFHILIQSAKTTKSSEQIIDSTYIAQMEMEKIYNEAKNFKTDYIVNALESLDQCHSSEVSNRPPEQNCYQKSDGNGTIFEKYEPQTNHYILLTITPKNIGGYSDFTRVLIQVFDKKGGKLKAQMENTIQWGTKS